MYSHMNFKQLPTSRDYSEFAGIKRYLEIRLAQLIDRETPEGEAAWEELTNHHCLRFVKEGMFILDRFWCNEEGDPSPLRDIVMRHIDSLNVPEDQYDDILLDVTW